jgi:hypothetical protein
MTDRYLSNSFNFVAIFLHLDLDPVGNFNCGSMGIRIRNTAVLVGPPAGGGGCWQPQGESYRLPWTAGHVQVAAGPSVLVTRHSGRENIYVHDPPSPPPRKLYAPTWWGDAPPPPPPNETMIFTHCREFLPFPSFTNVLPFSLLRNDPFVFSDTPSFYGDACRPCPLFSLKLR